MRDLRERGSSPGEPAVERPHHRRHPLHPWSPWLLLRNRFYLGVVVYRHEVCPGEHESMLERVEGPTVHNKRAVFAIDPTGRTMVPLRRPYCPLATCPRTSPAGFAAVWTLK
jgi:hypothetical protein